MRKFPGNITPLIVFVLLGLLSASCRKEGTRETEAPGERVFMTVRYASASPATRVSDLEETEGETRVNSLDILVYRADGTGKLDVHHRATAGEIASRTASVESPIGKKHIYLVANMRGEDVDSFVTEADLQSFACGLSANDRESFVMIGTPGREVSLVSGEGNDLSVVMRRLAARVSVRSITAEFTSPAQRLKSFRIRRIVLGYVNGTAPLCFGDVADPFGSDEAGQEHYTWPFPDGDAGYVNPVVLGTDGFVLTQDQRERDLTVRGFSLEEGSLYPLNGPEGVSPVWEGRILLYMYPNAAPQLADAGDRTTKLIIEAEYDGTVCWYPFVIADVQPNTAYTFSSITLTRVGNDDPDRPLDVTQAAFNLEVSDWATGEILGTYNGTGGFVLNKR